MSAVELDLCTDEDEELPEDTVDEWLAKQPAPPFVPLSLKHFVVPSHPWVIEVDGFPFPSLGAAEVYIDGYFVGVIDSYDGAFQRLSVEAGPHRVELKAEGFEPVQFEVMITPGETITYKGEMKLR